MQIISCDYGWWLFVVRFERLYWYDVHRKNFDWNEQIFKQEKKPKFQLINELANQLALYRGLDIYDKKN